MFIKLLSGSLLIWDFFLNIVLFKKSWLELNCIAVCSREKGAFYSFCFTFVIHWSIRAVGCPVWRELHLWYIWLLKSSRCIFGNHWVLIYGHISKLLRFLMRMMSAATRLVFKPQRLRELIQCCMNIISNWPLPWSKTKPGLLEGVDLFSVCWQLPVVFYSVCGNRSSDEWSYLCMGLNLLLENKCLALESIKKAEGKSIFFILQLFFFNVMHRTVGKNIGTVAWIK